MFKQFYNYLSKITVDSLTIGSALSDKKEEKALELIVRGQDAIANVIIGAFPLLKLSLQNNMYLCTAALLKYGADPNVHYKYGDAPPQLIQAEIDFRNSSNVKILILYGANMEAIDLEKASDELKTLIAINSERQSKIKKLQNDLTISPAPELKILSLEQQAEIWQEAARDETIPAYQSHYIEKSMDCFKAISKLSKAEMINKFLDEQRNQDNEHKPLLPKLKTH